jgi:uncharacterized protein YndB with AHSA1/START domain
MGDDGRGEWVVIDRTFDAPVDVIWQMWTVPEHFRSWFGPTGATIPVARMDVRVGGERIHCMEVPTPDGPIQMWFAGEFLEVVENERLAYTEAVVADEHGAPITGADAHSGVTEVRVELMPVAGGTRLILTHVGIPAGSPGEAGWTMAFDALDELIAR